MHPLPPPLPSASCVFFSVFLCVAGRAYWRGGGGGSGWRAKSHEKAWPSINHSILSRYRIGGLFTSDFKGWLFCCKFTVTRVYCTFYHIHSYSPTLTSTTPQFSSADKHTQKTGVLAGTTSLHLVYFLHKANILFGLLYLHVMQLKKMISSTL
jgi:hypothetical protein